MGDIEVRLHDGADALRGLAGSLATAGLLPAPSLAMDPEYLAAGLEGDHPSALVAYDAGRPVAYLPFLIRRGTLPLRVGPATLVRMPYRQLRLFGYRGAMEDPRGALDPLFSELMRRFGRRFDIAMASELADDDPLAAYLSKPPGPVAGVLRVEHKVLDSYRVAVAGTFEDYWRSRFSAKTRNTILRKLRLLENEAPGRVDFRIYTEACQVDAFLRSAEEVARRSYQWRRGYHVVKETGRERRRLEHLARRGQWRGYLLFVRDEPCAYCLGTVYGRKFDYDVPGYDERMARLSPGTVLLYRILEDLFASGMADELDFGAGPAEYKRLFATSNPSVVYLSLYPPRAYPCLLKAMETGCRRLAAVGKTWTGRVLIPRWPARPVVGGR
jgi:CelD/BcsL family acetyltransferase involved in cellulose biosynthesis